MKYEWIGSHTPYLDQISVSVLNHIYIGCYGGSTTSGASKNEDALCILHGEDRSWTFSLILDAHKTSSSAELILQHIQLHIDELTRICQSETAFSEMEPFIISILSDRDFIEKCRNTIGETSCLMCFQKFGFIWWFSIGDCMALLLHPELAQFDSFGLNQRQYYEWIGEANSFELPIPCYTVGRRQLRKGSNYILLLTDGVTDTEDRHYSKLRNLYDSIVNHESLDKNITSILNNVLTRNGKDSASMICWEYINETDGLMPSDQ